MTCMSKGCSRHLLPFIDGESFIGYRPNKMKAYLGITEEPKVAPPSNAEEDVFVSVISENLR